MLQKEIVLKLNLASVIILLYLSILVFPFEVLGQVDSTFVSSYIDEGQPIIGIMDIEEDLDLTFPQNGSLIPYGVPQSYFDFKDDLYDKIGLKIGVSYQMLFQSASELAPQSTNDNALGHWWGFNAKWTAINKGKDFEGSLVFTGHERVSVGNNAVPAQYGAGDIGAIWSNFEWTEWYFSIEDFYWEQWLKNNRFMFRIGNQIPTTIYNSFRFKDARTSFTSSPFAFHESIPYPTYGLGVAFKWWLIQDSELYIVGTLNDMNGDPNVRGFDWSTFGRGEYFYGIEIGKNWKREGGEFDHLHLDIFYADKRSTRSPELLPNEAGWGFKILGSKQVNKWVAYASYTYNTAEGGGISVTFAEHTGTLGLSYTKPFDLPGEISLGLMVMKPIEDILPIPDMRTQYGIEPYWKILLTPNLWVTPGVQFIINPSLNPNVDFVSVPHIKFRLAL
ncbi:carbohydrate porin [Lutimonas sp.]|uniref:carbohydrate porin n=1 Tax=Lutimonas sp. TaxID=1872403 RepID=UPI003D9AF79E